jgi:alkylation response protein AidB-like acyl-CoA dehydrogenase
VRTYPISKLGQKILPFSDVVFDHVVVEESYRLSSAAKAGFPQLFHMLEVGRVLVCAQSLGLAQAAMDDAVEHARSRTAFGENIGSFQQIQEKLVDMEVTLRNMRYAVYHAAWSFDADEPDKRLTVALMKRYVPKAATHVADAALQIFGGRGYTDDERVSWIWQDCRGNQISEGTDEIHDLHSGSDDLGRSLGGIHRYIRRLSRPVFQGRFDAPFHCNDQFPRIHI